MKKNIFLIVFSFAIFNFSANAQEQKQAAQHKSELKKEVFTVYGNCGMCERTIEGSLIDVKGIMLADWDKETDQIKVSYNPQIITLDAVKQKIADVGYDTYNHLAKDEVYKSLPSCCQYERPSKQH